jgi:hypothetical protein
VPSYPLTLNIWEPSATGVIGDAMMGISLIPRRSGSLDRLDVARGIEGKCSRTRLVNGCLISQERVLGLGAGQAILRETIVLDEPPSLYTGLMGLSAMFVAFFQRRFSGNAGRSKNSC